MKEKTAKEKVKSRIAFLERQITRIEARVKNYDSMEDRLTKHGIRAAGVESGRSIAKELELSFLEELLEIMEKEDNHER